MARLSLLAACAAAASVLALPAVAAAQDVSGSIDDRVRKPAATTCDWAAELCHTVRLSDGRTADLVYTFGPMFEPTHRNCYIVDGTVTLDVRDSDDGLSADLIGDLCFAFAARAFNPHTYGTPFVEHDELDVTGGTGAWAGAAGTGTLHLMSAGAVYRGSVAFDLDG
jgi:hypothetical protein